jgi:membrane associated rhomboid family serine protease
MATCYRHTNRETGVSCSNCGRPICPDCMTPTPVGMRCPECSRQKTPVRNMRTMAVEPIATYVLIALNVVIYFGASQSARGYSDLVLFGPSVGINHEWYRLISSGFMHQTIFHLLLNMYALFWLGRMIEPALGHARYVAIYLASLLTGSLGVIILSPQSQTVGASGAIFGLFGAAIVMARNRNINLMQSGLVPILVLNLVITFLPGSHISIGAHVGGLLGGLAVTFAVEELGRRRASQVPALVLCAVVGVAAFAAAYALAPTTVPGFG